jgi:hypothetical protein
MSASVINIPAVETTPQSTLSPSCVSAISEHTEQQK